MSNTPLFDIILRFPDVRRLTGQSRSTIDRMEAAGKFPKRRQITRRNVGWSKNEVDDWVEHRLHSNSATTPHTIQPGPNSTTCRSENVSALIEGVGE